jgi:hypothetical protein
MMATPQWKFKPQAIPINTNPPPMASPSSPGPSSHRGSRKRRHSEPHIQDNQNAYKHYVTHWKLPTSPISPANTTNTKTNTYITSYNIENTPYNPISQNTTSTTTSTTTSSTTTTTTSTSNPIRTTTNLTIDVGAQDWKETTQKQTFRQSPQVCRPSPISPTLSPHAIPPSPSPPNHPSDTNIQHWSHEPIKSMFHPFKRDPLSPSENNLTSFKDRRRNSAPHISYHPGTNPASLQDYRLETIPELSFPSPLNISPPHPPNLAPSNLASSFPTSSSSSLKNYASIPINSHKRPLHELNTPPDSSTYLYV